MQTLKDNREATVPVNAIAVFEHLDGVRLLASGSQGGSEEGRGSGARGDRLLDWIFDMTISIWRTAVYRFWTNFGIGGHRRVGIGSAHSHPSAKTPAELVEGTRLHWAQDSRVHIDDDPAMRIAPDGVWMQAWLLAGQVAHVSLEARSQALAGLPPMMREVFRLHRDSGLGFGEIAVRLGLGPDEVERYFAHALISMDRMLEAD